MRIPGHVITSGNVKTYATGLENALQEVAHSRKWTATFIEQVRTRMTALINDAAVYPSATGRFKSYKHFVQLTGTEVASRSAPVVPTVAATLPALDPWPVESGAMDIDPEEGSLLSVIHDEASQQRLYGDVPEEFLVGAQRRAHQKGGTLDPSVIPQVGIGGYVGEVRGHGNVVTNVGGGKGAAYADLWSTFATAAAIGGNSETAAAKAVLLMLHGDADSLLKYSEFALGPLDRILTILAGGESSRATVAVIHFAATVHHVSLGALTFKEAFHGPKAVFLGANEGGASALRHETPSSLVGQEDRARQVAETYLAAWGKVDAATLAAQIQTNIGSYSRKRRK